MPKSRAGTVVEIKGQRDVISHDLCMVELPNLGNSPRARKASHTFPIISFIGCAMGNLENHPPEAGVFDVGICFIYRQFGAPYSLNIRPMGITGVRRISIQPLTYPSSLGEVDVSI